MITSLGYPEYYGSLCGTKGNISKTNFASFHLFVFCIDFDLKKKTKTLHSMFILIPKCFRCTPSTLSDHLLHLPMVPLGSIVILCQHFWVVRPGLYDA